MTPPAPSAAEDSSLPGDPRHSVVLRAERLSKRYTGPVDAASPLTLFEGLDLVLHAGDAVAIVGQSGTGKSSLLHLLAGLDRPTAGQVWIGEADLTRLSAGAAAQLRNRELGFVWQFHYLLPEFTAAENIALPLLARGVRRPAALQKAAVWLERVELAGRAGHRSGELSGGEQQRVAIARALITEPRVLLADEPTGDLDDVTAAHLFDLLRRLCRQQRLAALLVTHNQELARRCDRMLRLQDGRLRPL